MEKRKNIIIGASSAGLYTAIKLNEENIDSIIIEKRTKEPGPRKLIVTPEIFKFINIPEEIIENRIKYFELQSLNYRIKIELKKPDIVIDRKNLIDFLEKKALRKGIKIFKGYSFENIIKEKNKLIAEIRSLEKNKKEYLEFDNLIAADGAKSKVIKTFNINLKNIFLYQIIIKLPLKYKKDTSYIWFNKKYTDYFIWLIPYNDNYGVLGLCSDKKENLANKVKNFVSREINAEMIKPESGITTSFNPLFKPEIKFNGKKILFVGDSAGQVKVTTVGGTFTGIWGGYLVYKAIKENKDISEFYKELNNELKTHFYIRKFLKKLEDHEYDKLLKKTEKKFKNLLYYCTRDEARKLLIKIFKNDPSLFIFILKKLL